MTPSELKALRHRVLIDFNAANEAARRTKCPDLTHVSLTLAEAYKTLDQLIPKQETDHALPTLR